MKKPGLMLLGVMLAACSSTTERPDDLPVLHDTTLTRYDGSAISVEELESLRPSAIAAANTIARFDRMLAEPWAEQRDARILFENLRSAHPADSRLAQTLWETTEPAPGGNGRSLFNEYGYYANQFSATGFGPRVRPSTLEAYIQSVLDQHSDADARSLLLAAWRRFAPLIATRQPAYLASSWYFEMDFVSPVRTQVVDSLLGPFERCVVGDDQASFFGPTDSYEGYECSVILLDLLTPGPASPIESIVNQLEQLAAGTRANLSFAVSPGAAAPIDDVDVEFLEAALRGIKDGMASVDSLPQGVKQVRVLFSYLIDKAEARAGLTLERRGSSWELKVFEYEPAAASLLGGNARLDLMPTIRALLDRGRQG